MRLVLAAAAILFALPAIASDAPPSPPPPTCDSPQHHQMDFWLGEWKLTWQGGEGTNRITRDFKNCVIVENFSEAPTNKPPHLRGMSVSTYHAQTEMWRQTWVDDQNGYYDLTGGAEPDGTFVLRVIRVSREPMRRMVFENIKPGSLTWRWQGSEDGASWTDLWVIQYTRVK